MRIHIIHTGKVHVSPNLPFGGENCSIIKASGMLTPKGDYDSWAQIRSLGVSSCFAAMADMLNVLGER